MGRLAGGRAASAAGGRHRPEAFCDVPLLSSWLREPISPGHGASSASRWRRWRAEPQQASTKRGAASSLKHSVALGLYAITMRRHSSCRSPGPAARCAHRLAAATRRLVHSHPCSHSHCKSLSYRSESRHAVASQSLPRLRRIRRPKKPRRRSAGCPGAPSRTAGAPGPPPSCCSPSCCASAAAGAACSASRTAPVPASPCCRPAGGTTASPGSSAALAAASLQPAASAAAAAAGSGGSSTASAGGHCCCACSRMHAERVRPRRGGPQGRAGAVAFVAANGLAPCCAIASHPASASRIRRAAHTAGPASSAAHLAHPERLWDFQHWLEARPEVVLRAERGGGVRRKKRRAGGGRGRGLKPRQGRCGQRPTGPASRS